MSPPPDIRAACHWDAIYTATGNPNSNFQKNRFDTKLTVMAQLVAVNPNLVVV